jgi:TPR repeat protein
MGHTEAQCCLGVMYEFGKGVTRNEETAVTWYRRAAEKNCAQAQFYLGRLYQDGIIHNPSTLMYN